jgi:Tol biopolymer transport system component/PKD repeat protein
MAQVESGSLERGLSHIVGISSSEESIHGTDLTSKKGSTQGSEIMRAREKWIVVVIVLLASVTLLAGSACPAAASVFATERGSANIRKTDQVNTLHAAPAKFSHERNQAIRGVFGSSTSTSRAFARKENANPPARFGYKTALPEPPLAAQGSVEIIAYDLCSIDYTGEQFSCSVILEAADGSQYFWGGDGTEPAWAPDGSKIAYVGYSQAGLFVLNLRDWSIASVHDSGASPAWSPDGTNIAFSDGELYVMNADGSNVVQVTSNVGFRGQPAWSPDGRTIAFDCEVESGNGDICAINADGTGFRRLTFDPAGDSSPAFSPDGFSIVFTTGQFGVGSQIAIMNSDGTGARPVGTGVVGYSPALSPSGTRIAFVVPYTSGGARVGGACDASQFGCNNSYPNTIHVMNLDGTDDQIFTSAETVDHPAWVLSAGPVASFFSQGCYGGTCSFDGSRSWSANPITSYAWDFGDGMTGSGPTLNHSYAAGGTYTVRLTIRDTAGATAVQSQNVYVVIPPTARFTYACSGWRCTFDGSGSSDPDGSITSYSWNFGDGGYAYGSTVTHQYNAGGQFTVTLRVTDNQEATGIQQQVISLVANALPVASFTATCTALACTFDGSGSSDSDGTIESYAWSFGDGTTASGVRANHTYTTPNTYRVSLTVTDNIGGSDVKSLNVTVIQPMHIGDLDGVGTVYQRTWLAQVTVTAHDSNHNPLANASVAFSWGVWGTGSCLTDSSGRCGSAIWVPKSTHSVTFTVVDVTGSFFLYTANLNHDPDGDSNGTSITVSQR